RRWRTPSCGRRFAALCPWRRPESSRCFCRPARSFGQFLWEGVAGSRSRESFQGVEFMDIPLASSNGTLMSTRQLTYVIYWHPKGNPLANGHAALIIDSVEFCNSPLTTDWYVSWCGGKNTWKGAKADPKGWLDDVTSWGGEKLREDWPGRNP